jgi:hypothetical protein
MHLRVLAAIAATLLLGCSSTVPPTASPGPTATPSPPPIATAAPTSSPAPTQISSPSAQPTATEAPSPTPATTPEPQGLRVDEAVIDRHLDALADIAQRNGGIRAAGTSGYDASADYVESLMAELGYEVTRQSFDFNFFDETAPVELTVGEHSWSGAEWLHANIYSASGSVSGQTEFVGDMFSAGCEQSDWNGFPDGRIAVVYGGLCYARDKVLAAQHAGASAIISLYPNWGANQTKRPTLLDPVGITIPAIAVGLEPADVLDDGGNGVNVTLSVQGETSRRWVDNVLAELSGGDEIVFLGGHLDSVLDGPGINDNGSGVATLLSLAQSLRDQPEPSATVRFGFWAAEEFGDLGSFDYVGRLPQAERDRISVYLNLDMVGSINAGLYVYNDLPTGEGAALGRQLLAALEDAGHPGSTVDAGGASDHAAFQAAGILTGGVFSGLDPLSPADAELFGGVANEPADPCYHLPCDTRANVDTGTAVILGNAIATVFEEWAY